MANRVSAAEVGQIIDTDLSDPIVDVFIGAANITVTDLIGSNANLSTAQLKEIERWLTAHLLACTREQQAQGEAATDAKITYQGKTGMGLDSTFYGQQVKLLDTTGVLAAQIGKKEASVYAITTKDKSLWGIS